jgi:hypothetical protein
MTEKYIDGWISWYTAEDAGSNPTVAFRSEMTCPNCSGEGCIEKFDILNKNKSFMGRCMRCSDGKLTNKIKYYRDFPGIALPNSIRERLGNPVPFTKIRIGLFPYIEKTRQIGINDSIKQLIINNKTTCAYYWDIQKDNNFNTPDKTMRIADLTPTVFEKLAPLSKGLIKGIIEVV